MLAIALLKELDIPFTRVEMGRSDSAFQAKDGSFTNEWYKKNVSHMGCVPTLVVDGKTLTENPAVLSYIASLKPERKMLGSDDWERAKVLEWMAWLSGTTHGAGVAGFLRPYRFTDEEAALPGIKKKAIEKIMTSLDTIEANVENSRCAVGNDDDCGFLFACHLAVGRGAEGG